MINFHFMSVWSVLHLNNTCKRSVCRYGIVFMFGAMVLFNSACGTVMNFMGSGHGGAKQPIGGVIIDGYIVYRGINMTITDGRPGGLLTTVMILDIPLSFVGDVITLPYMLSTPSRPFFFKNENTYQTLQYNYNVSIDESRDEEKFVSDFIDTLKSVTTEKKFNVDKENGSSFRTQRKQLIIQLDITTGDYPIKLMFYSKNYNQNDEEHTELRLDVLSELRERLKRNYGNDFSIIRLKGRQVSGPPTN